jgi:hypothetical protein
MRRRLHDFEELIGVISMDLEQIWLGKQGSRLHERLTHKVITPLDCFKPYRTQILLMPSV